MTKKIKEIENSFDLEDLYLYTDEGLKQLIYFKEEIFNIENENKIIQNKVISNKNLLILFSIAFIFSLSISVYCLIQKYTVPAISSIIMAIIIAVGIIPIHKAILQNKNKTEIERISCLQDTILNSLKDKLKNYYPQIIDIHSSYLLNKIADLKQEINSKIQQKNNIKELIEKNTDDITYYSNKLNILKEEIQEITTKKEIIYTTNKEIIAKSSFGVELSENQYFDVISIIQRIKDELEEKYSIEKTNEDITKDINKIFKQFKDFILENQIDISLDESFENNIEQLKLYNKQNNEIKSQLDIIQVDIKNLEKNITDLEIEKQKYSIDFSEEEISYEKLQILKEEKKEQKESLLGQKIALESFEGIEDLKNQRAILQDEYNKKIEELIKNKMLLSLCEMAKRNFDKNQPNLNNAQKFLSILTDGKYTKINLDLQEIQNEDMSKTKKWEELSRGTKELLYFALRLGFASNYSKDKITMEPNGKPDLPIIIDDAFVNFDSVRTKNAIKCLLEFSKTNQVLFFTCHSEVMKKYFEELCENYNVINL